MTIVGEVRKAVQDGTPLAQLAMDCNAAHVTGNPGGGQGQSRPARPAESPLEHQDARNPDNAGNIGTHHRQHNYHRQGEAKRVA